ncbi:FAD/NAD(P)-binding domain-containing protein [Aureobasidium namibiae CBS 147.97]|uniref:FAD/NAD(P)-binding domain-containing protein n=1 Tax=Aureobasidium namibiae CBS 147.97 TaxID=1043004 RepID=A0A074X1H6_9PEZI|nr:FAD/NAD(P)-binding domain-containing protein [Aureobasidium namibiae CBS 147.97]KEQ68491.1 FAD/NAD(P)-binding domain-containing protein [Aureobasidium namibiae CBS 147.97]
MLASPLQPYDVSLSHFLKSQPKQIAPIETSPREIARSWLDRFSAVLASGDASRLSTVLHQDSWWRDHVALSWDLRTLYGLPAITSFLSPIISFVNLHPLCLASDHEAYPPSVVNPLPDLNWIQSIFTFETSTGRGRGFLHLAQAEDGDWKAHMLYTALDEIKGHEEITGARRSHGGQNSSLGGSWFKRRQKTYDFTDEELNALIIGAGQAGLNLAARLQALGLSTLIVDRQTRVGDNWRSRYRTLVTYDPVTYAHMSYLPFPSDWPLYTPKDKLGDWFEAYVWLSTSVTAVSYSPSSKRWTVNLKKADGSTRTLHPSQLILATGHSGEPRVPSFIGQETFNGTIYHGSAHKDATPSLAQGKRVLVVGTGNSGHDIAQNYHEAGAKSVTMLQRSAAYVLQAEKGGHMLHVGTYDETVQFALGRNLTTAIKEAEKENLEGLEKAGFKIDFGHDGLGLFRKYMTKGGGYYIDVGYSSLITSGAIKVVRCEEGISHFSSSHIHLADGNAIAADIVVLATGYDNMRTSCRKILGDEIADHVSDVWDLDDEGELNGMWRPSGHPSGKFWYMGGNLALCRIYSKFLGLQIKAIEAGLHKV